ncbi:hypothetical protein A3K63_03025 [Candidatus Micrarchaeota archaeon RBG_16_49_10]|nr:MAG: hypothetical protein A3K63_03025 [Candidatus Micrarchaeota archaeon RBG_16_49_10]
MTRASVKCYHYRAVRIAPGDRIPPTVCKDYDIPEELWDKPLVWFVIGDKGDVYDAHGAYPRAKLTIFRHYLMIPEADIRPDPGGVRSWGYVEYAPVVVKVEEIRNPWVLE